MKFLRALFAALLLLRLDVAYALPPTVQPPVGAGTAITPTGGSASMSLGDIAAQTGLNVKAVSNAVGDGIVLSDVTVTSGNATISSASYSFKQADVGKLITILGAGSSATAPFNATISSVSGGNATLSVTPSRSIAGTAASTFCSDDTSKLQAAVNAVHGSSSGKGTLLLPQGIFCQSGSLTWYPGISLVGLGAGKSVLKWISTSDMTVSMITGITGSATNPYSDIQFMNFELDADAATQATYNLAGKAFFLQFVVRGLWENLYVHGTPATGIGADYLQYSRIVNNVVQNCGRLAGNGGGLGGSGIGIGTAGSTFTDGTIVSGNTVVMAAQGNYGIFVESQVSQSIASYSRIANNLIYITGSNQKAIGAAGSFNTLIEGNQVVGNSSSGQRGVSLDLGTVTTNAADPYGKSVGNIIKAVDIGFYYDGTGSAQSTYSPSPYTFENNTIGSSVRYGYFLHSGSVALDGFSIEGGVVFAGGSAAVYLDGTAGFKNLKITGLKAYGNGLTTVTATQQAAVSINTPVNRLTMQGNDFYDGGATKQLYALIINNAAVTNAHISANNFSSNATGAISLAGTGTLAGWVSENKGYNPVGAASTTPGASPWTYTAGVTPEVLILSGGTVSTVVKGGVTLGITSGSVSLQPGESVVVTYSVAPTAVADKR